jgi:hypothetical protein
MTYLYSRAQVKNSKPLKDSKEPENMGGQTLTKIFRQKRARGEKLEKLKNSSPSQPVVKRAMTRRSQIVNFEQPQAKGMYNRLF